METGTQKSWRLTGAGVGLAVVLAGAKLLLRMAWNDRPRTYAPGETSRKVLDSVLESHPELLGDQPLAEAKAARGAFRHGAQVCALSVSADGLRVASGGGDGVVRVWDVDSGDELWRSGVHGGAAGTAWLADGRIASWGDDFVRTWEPPGTQPVRKLATSFAELVWPIGDGRTVLGYGAGELRILDLAAGGSRRIARDVLVEWAAAAPDGETFAVGSAGWIGFVTLSDGASITRHDLVAGDACSPAAFGRDGVLVQCGTQRAGLVGRRDAVAVLWTRAAPGADPVLAARAQSPDVAAAGGRTIELLDSLDGRTLQTLAWTGAEITAIAFSPDGAKLWVADTDGRIEALDAPR